MLRCVQAHLNTTCRSAAILSTERPPAKRARCPDTPHPAGRRRRAGGTRPGGTPALHSRPFLVPHRAIGSSFENGLPSASILAASSLATPPPGPLPAAPDLRPVHGEGVWGWGEAALGEHRGSPLYSCPFVVPHRAIGSSLQREKTRAFEMCLMVVRKCGELPLHGLRATSRNRL